MKTIDVKGKLCPEPLIITKRAIKAGAVNDSFVVLLDNDVASCNLENYLKEMGIEFLSSKKGDTYSINFTLGASPTKEIAVENFCEKPTHTGDYVVVISSEGMGRDKDGSVQLGKLLMRGFINSLTEQDKLPKTIILYNSGVLVTAEGADTVEALKTLSVAGVDIILCGVCVDYYAIKEKIRVGRISNMFEITSITSRVASIIYP